MIPDLLLTLAITLVVELAVVWLSTPRALRRAAAPTCLFANLTTQPLAWYAVFLTPHLTVFLLVELAVILAELLAYRRAAGLPWRLALVLAVRANAVTIALSLLWS